MRRRARRRGTRSPCWPRWTTSTSSGTSTASPPSAAVSRSSWNCARRARRPTPYRPIHCCLVLYSAQGADRLHHPPLMLAWASSGSAVTLTMVKAQALLADRASQGAGKRRGASAGGRPAQLPQAARRAAAGRGRDHGQARPAVPRATACAQQGRQPSRAPCHASAVGGGLSASHRALQRPGHAAAGRPHGRGVRDIPFVLRALSSSSRRGVWTSRACVCSLVLCACPMMYTQYIIRGSSCLNLCAPRRASSTAT